VLFPIDHLAARPFGLFLSFVLAACGGDESSSNDPDAGAAGGTPEGASGGQADQGGAGGGEIPAGPEVHLLVYPDGFAVESRETLENGGRAAWRWLDAQATGLPLQLEVGEPGLAAGSHRVTLRLETPGDPPVALAPALQTFETTLAFEARDGALRSAPFDLPLGPVPPTGMRLVVTPVLDDGPASPPVELSLEDAYGRDPCKPFAPALGEAGGCVEAVIPMPGRAQGVDRSGVQRACGELGTVIGWLETRDPAASRCLRSRGMVEWANGAPVETEASGQCLADNGFAALGEHEQITVDLHLPVDGRDCGERRWVLTSDVGDCACPE
jgi:hypothetical protein